MIGWGLSEGLGLELESGLESDLESESESELGSGSGLGWGWEKKRGWYLDSWVSDYYLGWMDRG